eukprot:CAMPEP_0177624462 /NCGR_PEP_ID=MMETSP0419_2-20121207/29503_1 /TAXON_ID=582737 /ORGANISM="Tetraselmis sp., Strain GSL018" /LENGTH=293 /DNA_ID=CAMNT_0019125191 /DNA_START=234 /DNA_END=1113 /DNA_ORIENTATION=-
MLGEGAQIRTDKSRRCESSATAALPEAIWGAPGNFHPDSHPRSMQQRSPSMANTGRAAPARSTVPFPVGWVGPFHAAGLHGMASGPPPFCVVITIGPWGSPDCLLAGAPGEADPRSGTWKGRGGASQPRDDFLDLRGAVQVIGRRHAGDVDVGGGHLLLHDLLEGPEREHLSLLEGHVLPEVLLQGGLGALAARPDRLGVVLDKSARGVRVEQDGPVHGVVPGHQQRDSERAAHPAVLAVLAKAQREVAQRLRARLHGHWLVVAEAVLLCLDSCVLYQRARVRREPAHRATNV